MAILSPRVRDDRRAMVRVPSTAHAVLRAVLIAITLLAAGLLAGALLRHASLGEITFHAVGLAFVVPLWIIESRLRRRSELADPRLAEGRCPGCNYTLSGLAPEADGCTVCPECGAAWRVEGAKS